MQGTEVSAEILGPTLDWFLGPGIRSTNKETIYHQKKELMNHANTSRPNAVAEEANEEGRLARRLNVNLPEASYQELKDLAKRNGRSLTEVVKLALRLVKVALDERAEGNRLAITTSDGLLLKEIILP